MKRNDARLRQQSLHQRKFTTPVTPHEILENRTFSACFSPGSQAEVSVMGTLTIGGSERAISARLDRIAELDDRVLIVDYKTNRPPTLVAEDVPQTYRLEYLHAISGTGTVPSATVRICHNGDEKVQQSAWGDGPVDATYEAIRKATPLGRLGGEKSVADTVIFAVQNDFLTGTTLTVDGGRTLR